MNKVAVITPTIGRPTLQQCVDSVKAQTIPCTHYVFVDGKQFWESADATLYKERDVVVTQMPMNAGGDGYRNFPYLAGVPWLLREKYVAFLDDDNWWDETHLESCIQHMEKHDLDACFTLRNIVNADATVQVPDNCVSLGYYPNYNNQLLADTSTIVVKTEVAQKCGHAWYNQSNGDQMFTQELLKNKYKIGQTGKRTLYYRISEDSLNTTPMSWFYDMNQQVLNIHKTMPWCNESVVKFKDKL